MTRLLAALWAAILATFLSQATLASTNYSTNLTKAGPDLYLGWNGDFMVRTVGCSQAASSSASTLRIDTNTGSTIGQITFPTSATCNVAAVYSVFLNLAVGPIAVTLSPLDYVPVQLNNSPGATYFLDQVRGRLVQTNLCNVSTSFNSTSISILVPGRSSSNLPIGQVFTSVFGPGCNVFALYAQTDLAGYDLTINRVGTGAGTIFSTPGIIYCGSNCVGSFGPGTLVTLSASASLGSAFAGWSGICSGLGACVVTVDAAKAVTATFAALPGVIGPKVANISTRGQVLTGDGVMIAGFIIQGDSPQTVVVRARGPSLIPFGIANALANPVLQLFAGQTPIGSNDDWQTASNAAQVTASGFAPSNPLEAAILVTLNPGAYTAIVSGLGGGTGVAIVEVFAQ